jgi:hypothetical protein
MKMQPDVIAYKVAERIRPVEARLVVEIDEDDDCDDSHALENRYSKPDNSMQHSKTVVRDQNMTQQTDWTRFGPLAFRRTIGGYSTSFRPPLWLSGLLYSHELHIAKSYGDWKTILRTYHFVQPDRRYSGLLIRDMLVRSREHSIVVKHIHLIVTRALGRLCFI